ncbi:uncharacterized protein BCR38DRAFT_482125 [Pseudomassariella vexata]|uniref:Uncharacterized protein n=1 Tax=Pseudomassariella vexata TaxID=1141098 RepID=A0A1Y2EAQ3_9PEZI|nr:uncharacterized protein BCR38DRAFT_482125 [Pseudomassariella vexata]ORY68622.1 hypothetical protein BCR38DRAFT_482125 [Pseudomassariella vexata]
MTEPVTTGELPAEVADHERAPPPFAPIFTLVNNTSTRTTHHPKVHYIFSDDDPDLLTQALAQQHDANLHNSASDPALSDRAVILDLAQDSEGGYNVSWASSLSPSWAVVNAQVSQISPPSSDGGGGGGGSSDNPKKPGRLMLRIEGVESGGIGDGELKLSSEGSRQGSRSGSGSGSGQHKEKEGEDYTTLVDEFEKRMCILKKVVDTGEDRRRKVDDEAETDRRATANNAEEAGTGD